AEDGDGEEEPLLPKTSVPSSDRLSDTLLALPAPGGGGQEGGEERRAAHEAGGVLVDVLVPPVGPEAVVAGGVRGGEGDEALAHLPPPEAELVARPPAEEPILPEDLLVAQRDARVAVGLRDVLGGGPEGRRRGPGGEEPGERPAEGEPPARAA